MRGKRVWLRVRTRVRAFLGATLVVAVLWLVAVVAVKVLGSSTPFNGQDQRLVKTGRFVSGPLKELHRDRGTRLFFLHQSVGNSLDFEAWHKVALVVILVVLSALAVAGIDWLRRSLRRSRRTQAAGSH